MPIGAVEGGALDHGGDRRVVLAQAPTVAFGGDLGAAEENEGIGTNHGDAAAQAPAHALAERREGLLREAVDQGYLEATALVMQHVDQGGEAVEILTALNGTHFDVVNRLEAKLEMDVESGAGPQEPLRLAHGVAVALQREAAGVFIVA